MRKVSQGRRSTLSQGISTNSTSTTDLVNQESFRAKKNAVSEDLSKTTISEIQEENKAPVIIDRTKISQKTEPRDWEEKREISPSSRNDLRSNVAEVLVTEATCKQSLFSGEVDATSFKIKSPARIICHSRSPNSEGAVPDVFVAEKNTCDTVEIQLPDNTNTSENSLSMKASFSTNLTQQYAKGRKNAPKKTKGNPDTSMRQKKVFAVPSRYMESKDDTKLKSLYLSEIRGDTTNIKGPGSRTHSTPMGKSNQRFKPADGSILDSTLPAREAVNKVPKRKMKQIPKDLSVLIEPKSRDEEFISQLTLDLHYNCLLHQKFLMMKVKETFAKQEEKAKRDLYGLWSIISSMEKDVKTLEYDNAVKSMESAVDPLLSSQVEGFNLCKNELSKVPLKTSQLSDALSNTAHFLPIKNVYVKNEDELLQGLEGSRKLLGDLHSSTNMNQSKIQGLSSAASGLVETLKHELKEKRMCKEYLSAALSLANQERSFQVQLIQAQNISDNLLY